MREITKAEMLQYYYSGGEEFLVTGGKIYCRISTENGYEVVWCNE